LYILDNLFEVATGGIEDLAKAVGISTASVSRFVACLDYVSFSAFKQALLQAFKPPFMTGVDMSDTSPPGMAGFSFRYALSAVERTQQLISLEALEEAIALLSQAHTVYCVALGNTLPVANIASLCLAPYCNHIQFVEGGGEIAVHRLNQIGEDDLLFVFSFPNYSLDSMRLARFSKDRKAKLLTITDQPSSPLVPLSDLTLYTPAEHVKVPVSLVGAVTLIEMLASACAERFPDRCEAYTLIAHETLPLFHFEYSSFVDKKNGT